MWQAEPSSLGKEASLVVKSCAGSDYKWQGRLDLSVTPYQQPPHHN